MSDQSTPPTELPSNVIAFCIDGVVQDMIYTQDRLSAILLSNPMIVKVDDPSHIEVGKTVYDSVNKAFNTPGAPTNN